MMVELRQLVALMESKSLEELKTLGGVEGLAQTLRSDIRDGINDSDHAQRKCMYGDNILERKAPPTIFEHFVEAMQDTTVVILLIASAVSIVIGCIVCAVNVGSVCPKKPIWNAEETQTIDVSIFLHILNFCFLALYLLTCNRLKTADSKRTVLRMGGRSRGFYCVFDRWHHHGLEQL